MFQKSGRGWLAPVMIADLADAYARGELLDVVIEIVGLGKGVGEGKNN